MHKRYKKNSILKKILLPMAILIFAQCGIFYGTVFWSGTINQLKQNEYDILNERVVNRKNYLESEMVLRWSNMDKTPDNITHEMEAAAGRAGIEAALKHDRAFPAAALERAAEHVIDIIRRNSVTGAFVILNDERNTNAGDKTISTHSGIYIRDLEPDSNSVDNDDLLYEFGPSKITKDLGIPMDTWWQAGIPFLKEDTETNKFFNTPMERGNMYPDLPISSLGYWSGIHRMSKSDIDIMTYTVPLISNGVAYGVLGIEVSTDYIRGFLPEKEISNKKNGAYLLAIEANDKNTF
ncbi:MAG: diguanylate phosphodiesterase, partial [Clostridia bacterium]